MDNLICRECGITYYSAAAASMIARGETCDCSGALIDLPPDGVVPVKVQGGGCSDEEEPPSARRFAR